MISARVLERPNLRWFLSTLLIVSALIAGLSQGETVFAQTATYKTDRSNYPKPPLPALPRAGGKFIDPTFGTEIMRATDEADGPAPGLGNYYSHWPTFNCNNTRLLIRKGDTGEAILKDFDPVNFKIGTGYTTLPYGLPGDGAPSWESATWSNLDPDVIYTYANYYDGGMRFFSYNVKSRVFTLIRDFSELSGGRDYLKQMYVSADDDTFSWLHHRAGENNGEPIYYLVYRRSTNKILYHNSATIFAGGVNEVHVDKSGKWLHIVVVQKQADGTGTRFLNLETGQMQALVREVDHPPGHGDLGTGTIIGFDNYTAGISHRQLSNVHDYKQVLTFKSEAGITDWTNDFHGTMLANDEGWITIGTYDDPDSPMTETGLFDDEILQVSLDGSQRIRRICHTRSAIDNKSATTGYWAMPKPTISKDGRYIAFTSNWEKSGRYDLFIAKVALPPAINPNLNSTPTSTPRPAQRPRRVQPL